MSSKEAYLLLKKGLSADLLTGFTSWWKTCNALRIAFMFDELYVNIKFPCPAVDRHPVVCEDGLTPDPNRLDKVSLTQVGVLIQ
jgi:hypothetical protein